MKKRRKKKYFGPVLTEGCGFKEGDTMKLIAGGFKKTGTTFGVVDAIPVEILGAIEGELVLVEILKILPEKIVASVTEVLNPSIYRVVPACGYFLTCTGCQWQHIDYTYQLILKRKFVQDEVGKYNFFCKNMVDNSIPCDKQLNYRNHARFTVRNRNGIGQVGYVNSANRQFVKISECKLMNPKINLYLSEMQGNMKDHSQVAVRAGEYTESSLIQPDLSSNTKLPFRSGQTHYFEKVNQREYRIASPSFFQVNIPQLEKIITISNTLLEMNGKGILVDAYSGVGVFGSQFSKYVDRVIAIEESSSAVSDAIISNDDLNNIEYLCGKTEKIISEITEKIDYLILDPPRIGCHPRVLETILKVLPNKILMVSCDPENMMRDLNILSKDGKFKVKNIIPVDMFPQTRHIECLAFLERDV